MNIIKNFVEKLLLVLLLLPLLGGLFLYYNNDFCHLTCKDFLTCNILASLVAILLIFISKNYFEKITSVCILGFYYACFVFYLADIDIISKDNIYYLIIGVAITPISILTWHTRQKNKEYDIEADRLDNPVREAYKAVKKLSVNKFKSLKIIKEAFITIDDDKDFDKKMLSLLLLSLKEDTFFLRSTKIRQEIIRLISDFHKRIKGITRDELYLAGLDFNKADLTNLDLSSANLVKAKFIKAKLFKTSFEKADLTKALFKGKRIWGEDLKLYYKSLSNIKNLFSKQFFIYCFVISLTLFVVAIIRNPIIEYSIWDLKILDVVLLLIVHIICVFIIFLVICFTVATISFHMLYLRHSISIVLDILKIQLMQIVFKIVQITTTIHKFIHRGKIKDFLYKTGLGEIGLFLLLCMLIGVIIMAGIDLSWLILISVLIIIIISILGGFIYYKYHDMQKKSFFELVEEYTFKQINKELSFQDAILTDATFSCEKIKYINMQGCDLSTVNFKEVKQVILFTNKDYQLKEKWQVKEEEIANNIYQVEFSTLEN